MDLKRAAMRLLSFGAPVAVGLAILFLAVSGREPPTRTPPEERARAVRVVTIAPTDFTPSVTGFGEAAPARIWRAAAEVSGRVDYVHPALREGGLLREGLEILRISPLDYELAVQEAAANLSSSEARLDELTVQAENAERSREIEARSLEIKRADLERKRDLVGRSALSQSAFDDAERELLSQTARVQDLENSIRLFPSQIAAQEKQIDVNRARLGVAKLDLERTRIVLPFDARIASVSVEETQYVSVGAELAEADDIAVAEVTARIPQDRFRSFSGMAAPTEMRRPDGGLRAALLQADGDDAIGQFFAGLGWTAIVRLRLDGGDTTWPARILRASDTIDPETRTLGVIVAVERPYEQVEFGVRPPLVKGMFVEVELRGPTLKGRILAPRSAVRDGAVHVADAENRLRRRAVIVQAVQGAVALIADGLAPGDRVVLSDVSPAIEGMLLRPIEDGASAAASGENAAKTDEAKSDEAQSDEAQSGAAQTGDAQ